MKYQGAITFGEYTPVNYTQFQQSERVRRTRKLLSWAVLPLVWPLVAFAKISLETYRTAAEFIAGFPFVLGILVREQFYRRTLKAFGGNVVIGLGSVFCYPDVSVGSNVLIGMYNVIHYCDFESNIMVADHCSFLSGSKYHNFERVDKPMCQQGGLLTRIKIGQDCWIGAGAIVMALVNEGSVVGAGSVVTRDVIPFSIVAGNPARVIKMRQ